MTAPQASPAIDSTLLAAVRTKSATLAGTYGFSVTDRDDISQELLLDGWLRLRKFDPTKSSRRGFLRRVVGNRVATLLDAQRAACRDYRSCQRSLNEKIEFTAGDFVELGETVSTDDYEARIGRRALSSRDRAELLIDVAKVIAILPRELAAIANLLRSAGVGETAHQLGVPRSTMYRRIADIRVVFENAGLHLYLNCLDRASSKRQNRSCNDTSPDPNFCQRRSRR